MLNILEILAHYIKDKQYTLKQCHEHVEKEVNKKVSIWDVIKVLGKLNCTIMVTEKKKQISEMTQQEQYAYFFGED